MHIAESKDSVSPESQQGPIHPLEHLSKSRERLVAPAIDSVLKWLTRIANDGVKGWRGSREFLHPAAVTNA